MQPNLNEGTAGAFTSALTVPPAGTVDEGEIVGDRRRPRKWTETPRSIVLWYVAAFVAAEALGAYVGIEWQIPVVAVFLLVALNHALFGYRNARTAAVVMAALFTTRLVTLTIPISGVSISTRTGVIAVFAIVITRAAIWVMAHDVTETRQVEGFSLRKAPVSRNLITGLVALSGFPIGVAAYALLDPATLTVSPLLSSLVAAWTIVVLLLAIGALGEELIYRQLVAAMVQHTGNSQTPLISGVLFASIYLGTGNPAFVALAFFTGVWFAWSCEVTGSLRGPVIAHIIISTMTFVVLPGSGLF